MDANTGGLINFESMEKLSEAMRSNKGLFPVTQQQANVLAPMSPTMRKGYMRNQPCPCGSGKKFKRCCWDSHTG